MAAATTTQCQATYTSRDGGSTLTCTEPKGHTDAHYAGGPAALECELCGGEGHNSPDGAHCPCDECGHVAPSHIWAPMVQAIPAAAEYIYANATCWAENVCRECSPEHHAAVVAMITGRAARGLCSYCDRPADHVPMHSGAGMAWHTGSGQPMA